MAYLGALGFTKPLEKLVLHGVPLQSLLDWLTKSKGPHLVEASEATAPTTALVLVVTRRTLYEEDTPYVGVGLMYKPHYIPMEPFSAAYMHLNVWHGAGSVPGSPDKLESSRLMLIMVSEMSDVIPVTTQHPVFLDMVTKETLRSTGEPLAPSFFRGFRLHSVWNWPSEGDPVHQVAFPRLGGNATSPILEYEQEKFPWSLLQGSKISITLQPPSSRHWNIESDLILPSTVDIARRRHEAKLVTLNPEGESGGVKMSPLEAPTRERVPRVVARGSKEASLLEATRQRERDLETGLDIVDCFHTLRLQILHEMGGMRELEQAAIHTLMSEFARLQSILCEDLTKSLSALCSELGASSEVLSADILGTLNHHPDNAAFLQIRELTDRHHQSVSMKINLPLMELEAAREDLERFLQGHLHELNSILGALEVVEEISQTLSNHARRVQETIITSGIEQPGVYNLVMLALAVEQPVEAILFPGILDGLTGRLGLTPPSVINPPTTAREGMSH